MTAHPATTTLPVFPLGSVLLPTAVLPLHVFEERYRALVTDLLATDGPAEFGVVLIERGAEVGGGEHRTGVGTVARIVEAAESDDGRWALLAVGTQRFRVTAWHDDDPYPRASVELLQDGEIDTDAAELLAPLRAAFARVLALQSELETGVDATTELDDDPVAATWQAAWLAPLSPLDRQRLLTQDRPLTRMIEVLSLLGDAEELLRFRLGGA